MKTQLFDKPGDKSLAGLLVVALTIIIGAIIVTRCQAPATPQVAQSPALVVHAPDAAPQAVASLANPGFEDGFRNVDGVGELTVANGWWPWYVEGGEWHRPEYKGEPRCVDLGCTKLGHIMVGEWGQKQFTTYSRQDGGIYQQVAAERGKWYTFSAWVWVWSTDHDGSDSQGPTGKYSALVGINPWGDCRATYRTTVWGSEALTVYDQWVQVSVTAQAWADTICVFTRGSAEYAVKHNDSYWDAATLAEAGSGAVTPAPTYTPYPTLTPQPTYTPAPTCAPCPTCSPLPTPGATPVPGACPGIEDIRGVVREENETLYQRIVDLLERLRLVFVPVVEK